MFLNPRAPKSAVVLRLGFAGALACFCAAAVLPGRADAGQAPVTLSDGLMAYEGFNYPAGSLAGLAGGTGWAGGWSNIHGSTASIVVSSPVAGTHAPAGFDLRSAGNSARLASVARCGRRLDCSAGGAFSGYLDANGHIGADGRTLYVSFLQQAGSPSPGFELEFHRGDLGEAGRIAGIGNAFNSTTINLRAPDSIQTPLGWGDTNVNFYILRIDFEAGNDDITVYCNPTAAVEAGNEPVLTLPGAADLAFDGIALAASNGVSVVHDEIRLGASWDAVLGGPPMFVIQPTNQDRCSGQLADFTAVAQSAQPVVYQWYRRLNSLLPGETNVSLAVSAGAPGIESYWAVASNNLGSATSVVARLTSSPLRLSMPAITVLGAGSNLVLQASTDGAGPASFQWYKDGTALAGQTGPALMKTNPGFFDAGDYELTAGNSYGAVTATVTVVSAELGGLLAYEGFNYPGGNLAGRNGGTGWSGPWALVVGAPASVPQASLAAGPNAPPAFDFGSVDGSAFQPPYGRAGRFLDCSTDGLFAFYGLLDSHGRIGADGKTVYLSFLQRPNNLTSFYEFELHRDDLGDAGRIGGIGNDNGNATTVNLRCGGAQIPIAAGSTNVSFYVLRIDFHDGNDDVRVYQNPTTSSEPAIPSLSLPAAGDFSFNGISLAAYLNDRTVSHDEIRVGLTWNDVTGAPVSALRMIAYTNRQSVLDLAAAPGHTYRLQTSGAVGGPWTNLGVVVEPNNGPARLLDTNVSDPQRFYRALSAPANAVGITFADFEGATYAGWIATGTAFGSGPAKGSLPSQGTVSGFQGAGLVNSFNNFDASTGTLTSAAFIVPAPCLEFLIGGGNYPGQTCLNLLVNGVIVRSATGSNSETLAPVKWDVSPYLGQSAVLQVVDSATGPYGHVLVDQIRFSNERFFPDPRKSFLVTNAYLNLPVKTGAPLRRANLSAGGKIVRQFDIELADGPPDFWVFLDLLPFQNQTVELSVDQLLPADSTAMALIQQSSGLEGATNLYRETLRPWVHFSSRRGWLNDPNGLVWDQGEYHLYYQHNPYGWGWNDIHWGHAVSSNLVQWTELPVAVYPHQYGDWVFSGSAVVDVNNTSGFQQGAAPPVVIAYTSTGRGECIAYSNDRGRTFTEFSGNPVVVHNGRDPRLLWYAPSNHWVMAVYDASAGDAVAFYSSPDLKQWTYRSRSAGFYECPDLVQLPVDGQANQTKWMLSDAGCGYQLGQFDGRVFTPETAKLPGHGGSSFYAPQTYSRMPPGDTRCVRIGWQQLDLPGMPFDQMMSFPTELTLRTLTAGIRLCWQPVAEITNLYAGQYAWTNLVLAPGNNPLAGIRASVFDLKAQFRPGTNRVTFGFQGIAVTWDGATQTIICGGLANPLPPVNGVVQVEILADRDCVETFGNIGQVFMPVSILNPAGSALVSVTCTGGAVAFDSLLVTKLKSAWP
ncbi:MAG: hypothetical protein U1F98_09205 [Verrucomicrobiota bacterium]